PSARKPPCAPAHRARRARRPTGARVRAGDSTVGPPRGAARRAVCGCRPLAGSLCGAAPPRCDRRTTVDGPSARRPLCATPRNVFCHVHDPAHARRGCPRTSARPGRRLVGARSRDHRGGRVAPAVWARVDGPRRRWGADCLRCGLNRSDRHRTDVPAGLDAAAGPRRRRVIRLPVRFAAGIRHRRCHDGGDPGPGRHRRLAVNMFGALAVLAAFALSTLLVVPAARRTGLDIWHPATAWLLLEAVFFGIGGVSLALGGSAGPALFIAGAVAAFGLGTWMSDVLARRRSIGIDRVGNESTRLTAPLRPAVVAALVCLAVLAVGATVLRVGVPLFAGDITGARRELTGIPVQILRVALPGAALALTVAALRTPGDPRARLGAVALVSATLLFEIVLASRYLAAELVAVLVLALGIAGLPMPRRPVALTVAAGILAFAGIQVVRAYDQAAGREVAFAVERTANRLFLIQPRTLEALQAAIPNEEPYFGGLTWLRRAGPLFGRDDIPNLGYWIYPPLFPDQTP